MVYRIEIDKKCLNKAIEACTGNVNFCINKNIIYMENKENDLSFLEGLYTNVIVLIDANYKRWIGNSATIERWCYEKLIEQQLLEYEQSEECQVKLANLNKALDELQEKMGVNVVGRK